METNALADHLERRYGIDVERVTEIESVHRVDRRDGPSWVARTFPAARPLDAIEGDAEILRFLEQQRFPAERCADDAPVSMCGDERVLVTGLVPGPNGRPDRRPATLHAMGDLLGRLQTLPDAGGAARRPAGSWHHLSVGGGGRGADVAALELLLADPRYAPLQDELAHLDLLEGLPDALLHPDFVTANVLLPPDGPVLVDWTGAGTGPRIASLGTLLSTAATDLHLVDAIVAGYAPHVSLEPEELGRLAGAVRAFGFILDCWTAVHFGPLLPSVVQRLPAGREQAETIAARAREAFTAGG